MLASWLDFHRATLAVKCAGLDDAQARIAAVPSLVADPARAGTAPRRGRAELVPAGAGRADVPPRVRGRDRGFAAGSGARACRGARPCGGGRSRVSTGTVRGAPLDQIGRLRAGGGCRGRRRGQPALGPHPPDRGVRTAQRPCRSPAGAHRRSDGAVNTLVLFRTHSHHVSLAPTIQHRILIHFIAQLAVFFCPLSRDLNTKISTAPIQPKFGHVSTELRGCDVFHTGVRFAPVNTGQNGRYRRSSMRARTPRAITHDDDPHVTPPRDAILEIAR